MKKFNEILNEMLRQFHFPRDFLKAARSKEDAKELYKRLMIGGVMAGIRTGVCC